MKYVKANTHIQLLFSPPRSLNISPSDSDSQASLVLQLLIISLIMLLFSDCHPHLESTSVPVPCFLSYTVFDPQVCVSISKQLRKVKNTVGHCGVWAAHPQLSSLSCEW